jgi:hypothetical protein
MPWKDIKETYRDSPNKYSCNYDDVKPTDNIPEGSTLYEVQSDGGLKFYKFLQGDWREL